MNKFIYEINELKKKGNYEYGQDNKGYNKRAITYYQLAIKYYNDEKDKFINNSNEEINEINKLMSIVYSNLSITYLNGDEIIEALQCSNVSIQYNPHNPKAYYYQSVCKRYLGDYKGALQSIEQSLDIDCNEQSETERAELILILHKKDQEEHYYNRVLKDQTTIDTIKFQSGLENEGGRYVTSSRLIKKNEQIIRVAPFASSLIRDRTFKQCGCCYQKIEESKRNDSVCVDCNAHMICDTCMPLKELHHPKELCDCYKLIEDTFIVEGKTDKLANDLRSYIGVVLNVIREKRGDPSNNRPVSMNGDYITNSADDVLGLSYVLYRRSNKVQSSIEYLYHMQSGLIIDILKKLNITGYQVLSKDDILNIIRTIGCNSHSIINELKQRIDGGGLYPYASYFNHSCIPNTNWFTDKDGIMVVYASDDIQPGTEITLAYDDITNRVELRRNSLLKKFGFFCNCPQCKFQSSLTEEYCEICNEIIQSKPDKSNLIYKRPQTPKETGWNYICSNGHCKPSFTFDIDNQDQSLCPTVPEIYLKCKDLRNFRKYNIFKEMIDSRDLLFTLPRSNIILLPLAEYVSNPNKLNSTLRKELIQLFEQSFIGNNLISSIQDSPFNTFLINLYFNLFIVLLNESKQQIDQLQLQQQLQQLKFVKDKLISLLCPLVYSNFKSLIDKKLYY